MATKWETNDCGCFSAPCTCQSLPATYHTQDLTHCAHRPSRVLYPINRIRSRTSPPRQRQYLRLPIRQPPGMVPFHSVLCRTPTTPAVSRPVRSDAPRLVVDPTDDQSQRHTGVLRPHWQSRQRLLLCLLLPAVRPHAAKQGGQVSTEPAHAKDGAAYAGDAATGVQAAGRRTGFCGECCLRRL
jgi:hypothetical protein